MILLTGGRSYGEEINYKRTVIETNTQTYVKNLTPLSDTTARLGSQRKETSKKLDAV